MYIYIFISSHMADKLTCCASCCLGVVQCGGQWAEQLAMLSRRAACGLFSCTACVTHAGLQIWLPHAKP